MDDRRRGRAFRNIITVDKAAFPINAYGSPVTGKSIDGQRFAIIIGPKDCMGCSWAGAQTDMHAIDISLRTGLCIQHIGRRILFLQKEKIRINIATVSIPADKIPGAVRAVHYLNRLTIVQTCKNPVCCSGAGTHIDTITGDRSLLS